MAATTLSLGPEANNVNVDGSTDFTDFGGVDTYTVLSTLSDDVTITDNSGAVINLPEGLTVSDVAVLSNGLQFKVGEHTVQFLGAPEDFTYVFAGTPLDPAAGTSRTFEEAAEAFGTTVPEDGEPANTADGGSIDADGSVSGGGGGGSGSVIDLTGQTAVSAVDGTAEVFVLEFDSGGGTTAVSTDAVVTISNFDPETDTLRFDDASTPAVSASEFLNLALVAENGFTGETTIAFQDDDPNDATAPAVVTLAGVLDASLGGADPFFEVV